MRWINTSSPPVLLDGEQLNALLDLYDAYQARYPGEVFFEFGHHPWGQDVVIVHFADGDDEGCWEAFWLLDDWLALITPDEHAEAETLVADIVAKAKGEAA